MNVTEFELFLPGKPPPRQQPDTQIRTRPGARERRGGMKGDLPHGAAWLDRVFALHYPNAGTEAGMARWRRVWIDHPQRPYIVGAIAMEFTAYRDRAQSHYRADGTLSAEGLRWPLVTMKPDLDNLEKLAADALKGRAFDDDSCIVEKHSWKHWASPRQPAGILLKVWSVIPSLGMDSLFP